ncbi:MAG: NAD-glutamate dehydrogenase, partial [Chloroflexi bacterium]|nr:NAD-glutamate dehydrogenase [Chloroflexota bacterium]
GILGLGERQRTRLFMRRDAFRRFYSCLIYTPRENFDTALRKRMQQVLLEALNGDSTEFNVLLTESALARIHILVHVRPDSEPNYTEAELEKRLVKVARRWEDELFEALRERHGEERGNLLYLRYREGFPASYRADYEARAAVGDIDLMESLSGPASLAMNLYLPLEARTGNLRFKILQDGEPVPLSVSLPMLEHMGVKVLEERPYAIQRESGTTVWIHDIGLSLADAESLDIDRVRDLFQEVFLQVWRGADDSNAARSASSSREAAATRREKRSRVVSLS